MLPTNVMFVGMGTPIWFYAF